MIVDRSVKDALEYDIVIATVDGASNFTIKTLRVDQDGNKYLEPANPEFENIYPQESLEIL